MTCLAPTCLPNFGMSSNPLSKLFKVGFLFKMPLGAMLLSDKN